MVLYEKYTRQYGFGIEKRDSSDELRADENRQNSLSKNAKGTPSHFLNCKKLKIFLQSIEGNRENSVRVISKVEVTRQSIGL